MHLLSTPEWLLDPRKTPTIDLGFIQLPGPVLPLLVSIMFIHHKSKRPQQPPTQRPNDIEKNKPKEEATSTNPLQHTATPSTNRRKHLYKTLLAFHVLITTPAIYSAGTNPLLPTLLLGPTQSFALLLQTLLAPQSRLSNLTTALGWALLTLQAYLPPTLTTPTTYALFPLALPVAWQLSATPDLHQSASGLLLLISATTKLLFATQAEGQEWAHQHPWRVSNAVSAAYLLNMLVMHAIHKRVLKTPTPTPEEDPSNSDASQPASALSRAYNIATFLARISLLLATLLTLLAAGMAFTGFLAACLFPFVSGCNCPPAPELSILSFILGALAYLPLWSVAKVAQEPPRGKALTEVVRSEVVSCAEVLGWACTVLNVLWMVVKVVGGERVAKMYVELR